MKCVLMPKKNILCSLEEQQQLNEVSLGMQLKGLNLLDQEDEMTLLKKGNEYHQKVDSYFRSEDSCDCNSN
jgi:hypothetical protein